MGQSARNLALCQIEFSRASGYYPIWGWASSESPDGKTYLGWGCLRKNVVAPYAPVLAIADFSQEAIASLRTLEKHGMRPQYETNRGKSDFGFTDAYDTEAGTASKNYLVLDQAMLFLSLANFLYDDIVRNSFSESSIGNKAAKKLLQLEKDRRLDGV